MGKAEGQYANWHGHVTALTVAPNYRRLGLAKMMMDELERVTDCVYRGFFVDLFVRVSNEIAIKMYERFGYSVYRRVIDYYSGFQPGDVDEDAYGLFSPILFWEAYIRCFIALFFYE
jgi:N-terminal acetyltransferase B complex catalytic subunit